MTAVRHTLGALTSAYTSDVDPMKAPIQSAGTFNLANRFYNKHKFI